MDLNKKYKNYRSRLKAEFLIVGEDSGCSLPADARKTESIHFGDATVFLGWYIGILATEHFLLQKSLLDSTIIDISDTEKELYFTLKALERLMTTAPDAFNGLSRQCSDEPMGFFIRDDVKFDLKEKFGVENIESDFIAGNPFQKEESQDQLIHLLLGLALVKRFIPKNIRYKGKSLLEFSQLLAFKICSWPSTQKWIIRNPFCENKKVNRGSCAVFFSFPIVIACRYISDNETDLIETVPNRYIFLWHHILKYKLPCIYNPTNCHLVLTLACISNTWGVNSLKYISNLSQIFDWPAYPMIHIAVHRDQIQLFSPFRIDRYISDLTSRAESMLREAPWEGPSYEESPRGWKAPHRFLAGIDSQNFGYEPYEGMYFSGVDFMLLHNIYQIIKNI